jgi:hypothetical protein
MSNKPIVVTGSRVDGIELPAAATRNIIRSPLVVLPGPTSSDLLNVAVGARTSAYRVTLVANGKTFNMLLPPSVESKHPSRSNPLQLPGLQIDAGAAISKLKIPGFFPIYQHLGVESLTISMSGMFTGYDGVERISTATNWEAWDKVESKEGQDSYASACELYDFAVKNKALIEVTIYTSDGTFIPKKSDTTNFRDSSSNIKFKGYIKDFKQVYIRQDRNYYMLKFEIIDLGGGAKTCIAKAKEQTKVDKTRGKLSNSKGFLTEDDVKFLSAARIEELQKITNLINNKASKEEVLKAINEVSLFGYSSSLRALDYAIENGYNFKDNKFLLLKQLAADSTFIDAVRKGVAKSNPENKERDIYLREILLNQLKKDCIEFPTACDPQQIRDYERLVVDFRNANSTTSPTISSTATPTPTAAPITPLPITEKLKTDLTILNDVYGDKQQRGLIKVLRNNNGTISDATMSGYATLGGDTSKTYTYVGNSQLQLSSDPQIRTYGTFKNESGDALILVPTVNDFSKFKLIPKP